MLIAICCNIPYFFLNGFYMFLPVCVSGGSTHSANSAKASTWRLPEIPRFLAEEKKTKTVWEIKEQIIQFGIFEYFWISLAMLWHDSEGTTSPNHRLHNPLMSTARFWHIFACLEGP